MLIDVLLCFSIFLAFIPTFYHPIGGLWIYSGKQQL
jgi:hypothetical protein